MKSMLWEFEQRRMYDSKFNYLCRYFEWILIEAQKYPHSVYVFWKFINEQIDPHFLQSDINDCVFVYLMSGYNQTNSFHWDCFETLRDNTSKIERAKIKNETAKQHGFNTANQFGDTFYGSMCNFVLGDTTP